jgi:predicted membrane channel-forming protein YqfA (hemolysin III family)
MNDTRIFSELLGAVATQLPVLLVSLVGIMVALISWRRAPAASLWTFLAFGLALLLCILIPISQQTMLRMMKESSLDTRVTANIVLGIVWSIVRAISYVLLLVGVYAGRKSASPA